MKFVTWFGQMRPKPTDDRPPWNTMQGKWYFNPKFPFRQIMLRDLRPPGDHKSEAVSYYADVNGCMEVEAPEHIKDFIALGYPIWDGVTKLQLPEKRYMHVKRDGLIWPDDFEYDRRVMEALNKRSKVNG